MHPPSAPALLIIDMQEDFASPGGAALVAGAPATVPAIARLLAKARAAGWPVVFVVREHAADGSDAEAFRRHLFREGRGLCVAGSPGARIIAGLAPLPGERVVKKRRMSAFFGTELDSVLRELGADCVVLAGTQLPNCVRAAAVDALARDLRVVLVPECCSAQSPETAAANLADLAGMGAECVGLDGLDAALSAR